MKLINLIVCTAALALSACGGGDGGNGNNDVDAGVVGGTACTSDANGNLTCPTGFTCNVATNFCEMDQVGGGGECDPLNPFSSNRCPANLPKCSYAFISAPTMDMPNAPLIISTKCLAPEDGATTTYDECNQFFYDENMPVGDTCGVLGLDTPADPTDDKTFACVAVAETARCQQLCNTDPMADSGCPAGWGCTGFSNVFDDVSQSVGFCSPGCDPLQDPSADPNGTVNERCTIDGTQCYALASGTRTCASPGTVTTLQDCMFLNDCAGPGESCRDFNENGGGNNLGCGLYCDPTVTDKNTETYNVSSPTPGALSTCGTAIAGTQHPNALSGDNFTCLPLSELFDDVDATEGTCHFCANAVDGNACCNGTDPNMNDQGQVFCFPSCLELLGCPLPANPVTGKPIKVEIARPDLPTTDIAKEASLLQ